jgi:hypothetical protein
MPSLERRTRYVPAEPGRPAQNQKPHGASKGTVGARTPTVGRRIDALSNIARA